MSTQQPLIHYHDWTPWTQRQKDYTQYGELFWRRHCTACDAVEYKPFPRHELPDFTTHELPNIPPQLRPRADADNTQRS